MGLLDFFRDLFRGAPPSARAADAAGGATATLEPPADAIAIRTGDDPAWWVPRGEPVLAPPESGDGVRAIDRELYDACVRTLDDPHLELPQLPQVGQQLLMLLHDPDADLRRAAELAGRDPALAADVLRLVNSAAFRGIREVRRLDQAFVRLGQRAVRSLVLASSLKGLAIRTGGTQRTLGEELWRCAVASGVVISALAPRFQLSEDDAFLVGLLHDIGMLGVLKVTHDFQRASRQKLPRPAFDALARKFHEHLGLRLADAWGLPDPLPALIGSHHRRPEENDPLKTYRLLIAVADATCALLEYAPYTPYDFFRLPCVEQLGLTEDAETCELLAGWPGEIGARIEFS